MIANTIYSILKVFGYPDPSNQDLLILFTLVVAIFAAYMAIRVRRFNKVPSKRGMKKVIEKVEKISIAFDDLTAKVAATQVNLEKDRKHIVEKLSRVDELQSQIDVLNDNAALNLQFDSGSPLETRIQTLEKALVDLSLGKTPELNGEDTSDEETVDPSANGNLDLSLEDSEGEQAATLYSVLAQTRDGLSQQLKILFTKTDVDKEKISEKLENALNSFALGKTSSEQIVNNVQGALDSNPSFSFNEAVSCIKNTLSDLLRGDRSTLIGPRKVGGLPEVILVIGAQSVGKTALITQLIRKFKVEDDDFRILLAQCNSLREQTEEERGSLEEKLEIDILHEPAAVKASTVAYKALHRAQDNQHDIVFIEATADLGKKEKGVTELESIVAMISREQPTAPHEIILTLDSSLGELALEQAKSICEVVTPTGLCITKLDKATQGGVVVALRTELGLPLRYLSIGPNSKDVSAFSESEFIDALFRQEMESGYLEFSASPIGR